MRHAVLGANGLGGTLATTGHPASLLSRLGRREQYPERLSVESGTLGSFEAPVRDAEQLDEPFHVVWIPVE
jgi:hypothetical protein